MDLGSVSVVSTITGGEIFWHPRFLRERDGPIVYGQLRRLTSRMQGFNCVIRVRCSDGRLPIIYGKCPLLQTSHLVTPLCRPAN